MVLQRAPPETASGRKRPPPGAITLFRRRGLIPKKKACRTCRQAEQSFLIFPSLAAFAPTDTQDLAGLKKEHRRFPRISIEKLDGRRRTDLPGKPRKKEAGIFLPVPLFPPEKTVAFTPSV